MYIPSVRREPTVEAKDPAELIREAFQRARLSGKADWYRMTTAVLKNRLLTITGGRFDERQLGFRSFAEFLTSYSKVVRIDRSQVPQMAELLEASVDTLDSHRPGPTARPRIRPDLWQAAMDFTSGIEYVWDSDMGRARPRLPSDHKDAPIVPTITEETLQGWRKDFIARTLKGDLAASPDLEERLDGWATKRLGTLYLPPELRGLWNEYMRQAVVDRLDGWFNKVGLSVPQDLLQVANTQERIAQPGDLPSALLNLLARLNKEELSQLQLPAAIILRALQRRDGA